MAPEYDSYTFGSFTNEKPLYPSTTNPEISPNLSISSWFVTAIAKFLHQESLQSPCSDVKHKKHRSFQNKFIFLSYNMKKSPVLFQIFHLENHSIRIQSRKPGINPKLKYLRGTNDCLGGERELETSFLWILSRLGIIFRKIMMILRSGWMQMFGPGLRLFSL